MMLEPVSRTYVSEGLALHYLDWGNDDAPLLLLIHGMRDHARSWDWTARALHENWHIVAADLRGHGDSQWSPDGAYIFPYHLLDLANLIAALGHTPLTIVGHSYGGNVAARYAAMFPEHVRKLVMVEGLGPPPSTLAAWEQTGPVKRTRAWVEKRRELAAETPRRFATMEEAIARMAKANGHLSEEQARHLAIHGLRHYADGYGWKYDPRLGVFAPEDFAVDREAFWRELTTSTLLCYGMESWTSNPEADGRAAIFPNHRTVLFERAGHWIHHDQFEAFMGTLSEFLP
jgi:pimeloyl-ACP methyl ester carboxylesterase